MEEKNKVEEKREYAMQLALMLTPEQLEQALQYALKTNN